MFRTLASRLVLIGLVQLALLVATGMAILLLQGPRGEGRPHEVLDAKRIATLTALVDRPAELTAELELIEEERIEVSVYDGDKRVVASNVDPPLAIPERRKLIVLDGGAAQWQAREPRQRRVMVVAWDTPDGRGYLVARGVHRKPSFVTGPLLALISGFVIMIVGALFTARWIVRPIDRVTRTARALGAGDLSARSRLARSDEIGELGARIDEMADRIERLLVTEKELLGSVAHELRTPLSRIGVALDLASEGDSEAARASLAEIAVDVGELEAIVDDILVAMRFEVAAGDFPLKRAVMPPSQIAEAAAKRLRERHRDRTLEVSVASDLPAIDVDQVLFRRVIDNLLANAHKYTPDAKAPLALAVTRDGEHVVFEVRDPGIGISADDLPRVFTAFFRGDKSRSRETGGVGLGLTLAKRIVDAHGGTIGVTSELGRGTTVRVRMPAA